MDEHQKYMQRALDLAGRGLGKVSPNPMVGCVIVHKDRIIGEGWHQKFGGPHAEVNAINSVGNSAHLPKSTLYVTLEPCSHHGKTPPCADLIISSGVKKVIIANTDPNPKVSGKGVMKLLDAGVEVEEGILEATGMNINKRFFTFHQKKRPFIILKWAETSDGFIARLDYDSKWISNELSRQLVHQYRAHEDAIMVGRNTAHYDDPQLTVRDWPGKDPLRIVLDPTLQLDEQLRLFDGSVPTIRYNHIKNQIGTNVELVMASKENFLETVLKDLYQRNIQSVLVEGGAKLINSLLDTDYWDEALVFTSGRQFEDGIKAPVLSTPFEEERSIKGDTLKVYRNASH